MMPLLQVFSLAVLAFVVFVGKLMIWREYDSWAPALARAGVRLAGLICPFRSKHWWADLCCIQVEEEGTGLFDAALCLATSTVLAVREPRQSRWRPATTPKVTASDDANILLRATTQAPIESLGLTRTTVRTLKAHKISTIDQVIFMREEELLRIRNIGRTKLDEIKERLVDGGFVGEAGTR